MFKKLKQFLIEMTQEMKKVTWPSGQELRESTQVVIVAIVLVTAFTYIVDWIFSKGILLIFR